MNLFRRLRRSRPTGVPHSAYEAYKSRCEQFVAQSSARADSIADKINADLSEILAEELGENFREKLLRRAEYFGLWMLGSNLPFTNAFLPGDGRTFDCRGDQRGTLHANGELFTDSHRLMYRGHVAILEREPLIGEHIIADYSWRESEKPLTCKFVIREILPTFDPHRYYVIAEFSRSQ